LRLIALGWQHCGAEKVLLSPACNRNRQSISCVDQLFGFITIRRLGETRPRFLAYDSKENAKPGKRPTGHRKTIVMIFCNVVLLGVYDMTLRTVVSPLDESFIFEVVRELCHSYNLNFPTLQFYRLDILSYIPYVVSFSGSCRKKQS
jgi:hypothetical protein